MKCTTAQRHVQLDLDAELSPRRRAALQQHLRTCANCRKQRRQLAHVQALIHGLAEQSERSDVTAARIEFGQRQAFPWRGGLAAAAVLALCMGGWLTARFLQATAPEPPAPAIVQTHPDPAASGIPDPRSLVEVTFEPAADVIAVPMKTENPNITIIWAYPIWKTAKASVQPSGESPPSS